MLVNSNNINHFAWLKAVFTEDDVEMYHGMDRGYIPTPGVLSQREEKRQDYEIGDIIRVVLGSDFVCEPVVGKRLWIGMKGEAGRDIPSRTAKMTKLAKELRKFGYKARCQTYKGLKEVYVRHNETLKKEAARVHPLYVAWLKTQY